VFEFPDARDLALVATGALLYGVLASATREWIAALLVVLLLLAALLRSIV
jgi:hypothetical protein